MSYSLMVIEDNEADVFLLHDALFDEGLDCSLTVFNDGGRAYDHLLTIGRESAVPDLLLVDLNLPRRSGFDILDQIGRVPALAGVPVVVWSSASSPEDTAALKEYPLAGFIAKPCSYSGFMKIGRILGDIIGAPSPARREAGIEVSQQPAGLP